MNKNVFAMAILASFVLLEFEYGFISLSLTFFSKDVYLTFFVFEYFVRCYQLFLRDCENKSEHR